MGSDPVVWALQDGKAGMASQAVGLAEATGFHFAKSGELRITGNYGITVGIMELR